eukprot:TRINITY_DN5619_c0_g1_i1.p1 TRINITY_DN5619_c0_g1~~TRINITY_DN5619_c0_g1_i1.p1  ORF type:complete len:102 (+),score=26.88 TRINITY_DN5619_c0_g1_i1:109-414(+)
MELGLLGTSSEPAFQSDNLARELALQIYKYAQRICQFHNQSLEALTRDKKLLVCSATLKPQQIQNNHLQVLTIDEADRIVGVGFEQELCEIIKTLPNDRQP